MKNFLSFFVIGFIVSNVGSAVELSQATNADLLNEVARRMGGSPAVSEYSSASYLCDSNGNLQINLLSALGNEAQRRVNFYNMSQCQSQSAVLISNATKIFRIRQIAVCDSNGNMLRYSLSPQGTISDLAGLNLYNMSECLKQAELINGVRP